MQLPPNVRFIGTANHDETTLDFAPKTYDRSNVMVMGTNDKSKVMEEIRVAKSANPTSRDRLSVDYHWLREQFADAEVQYLSRYEEFDKFIKTQSLCNWLNDRGIGIGNRFDERNTPILSVFTITRTTTRISKRNITNCSLRLSRNKNLLKEINC